jgi:hypothetical protein
VAGQPYKNETTTATSRAPAAVAEPKSPVGQAGGPPPVPQAPGEGASPPPALPRTDLPATPGAPKGPGGLPDSWRVKDGKNMAPTPPSVPQRPKPRSSSYNL